LAKKAEEAFHTMDFLIRLVQVHESFREPELKALAQLAQVKLELIEYSMDVRQDLIWSTR
jgi:tRNA G10  N-methylase Trm11